jgi:hypothetical protein
MNPNRNYEWTDFIVLTANVPSIVIRAGTTEDPGFWLEWSFIEDGQECMDYNVVQSVGTRTFFMSLGSRYSCTHDMVTRRCRTRYCWP